LYDQKNNKLQYSISIVPVAGSTSSRYSLKQGDFVVAEAVLTPISTTFHFEIKSPKYGGNIEVFFQGKNKNHFIAKRDGNQIAAFEMLSDTTAYLDIAKGEKRNFAFAFMALFVIWFEDSQGNNKVIHKYRSSRSKIGESGDSSDRSKSKSGQERKSKKSTSKENPQKIHCQWPSPIFRTLSRNLLPNFPIWKILRRPQKKN